MRAPAPTASSSLVGLIRLTTFWPGVLGSVILPELEVSTTSGTPCWAASGIMASVMDEPQAPMMTGTLSRTISFSAAFRVSAGSDLLSSMMSSRGRPSTPPFALTRSRAILAPFVMYDPAAAMGPDSGWIMPTLMGSFDWAEARPGPTARKPAKAASTAHAVILVFLMECQPP